MNAEVINLADRLAEAVGTETACVDLSPLPDDESVERHANLFRTGVRHYSEMAAAAKRAWTAEAKALGAERKLEEERHRAAMAALDEREADMHARGKERVDAAQLLEASFAGALATAEGRR